MAEKFKHDIYCLIKMIESNECIWENSDACKDEMIRKNAWRDICLAHGPDSEDMEQETEDEITCSIPTKWCNIWDTFIKWFKTKSEQPPKEKYLYSDNLQCLLKTVSHEEADTNVLIKTEHHYESRQLSTPPSKSTKYTNPEINVGISKAIQASPAGSERLDDDLAFMTSLLPTLKQLNDDDKFEFKIEVMLLLRRLNKRRLSTPSDDPSVDKNISR